MYFDAKEFGKRLQEQRKGAGMTQDMVAETLGLSSKHYVSKIERGELNCSIDLLVQLTSLYNVSTDYLLMGKDVQHQFLKENLESVISQLSHIAEKI